MARKTEVLWTKSRSKELGNEVKNYNRRLKRALKKIAPGKEYLLPELVKVKDIKQKVTTTQEYKSALKQLKLATAKTLTIKNEKTEYSKLINRYKTKVVSYPQISQQQQKIIDIAKNMDVTPTLGRFPTSRDILIRDIGLKQGDINNYKRIVDWVDKADISRAIRWKENYLKVISENIDMNIIMGNPDAVEILEEIESIINKIDIFTFITSQLIEGNILGIGVLIISPPSNGKVPDDEIERQIGEYERLFEEWKKYV